MIHLAQIVIILAIFFIAWWLELIGGILYIIFGAVAYFWWYQGNIWSYLMLCLPLVLIGILLIATWSMGRGAKAEPAEPVPPDTPASP
jgi:hypothetical protein